jgi:L-xylulose reductase
MRLDLGNKRVLVTGAGSGIGMEIALTLALQCNARVVALDYSEAGLKVISERVVAAGGSNGCMRTMTANLLDTEGSMNAVQQEMDEHGPFEFLVNCAGVAKFQPVFETDPSEFDRQYGVNVKPCIFLTQVVAERLVKHDPPLRGSIVHISSQSSTLALGGHLVYSSGKAAVDHVARIQALEFGPHGIRVNSIKPTVVLTEMVRKAWDPAKLEVGRSLLEADFLLNMMPRMLPLTKRYFVLVSFASHR